MGKWVNWVHGTDVNVEWPDRVLDGGPNTPDGHPRRAGWGTDVRQRAQTFNWFHFAVPTPTEIDSDDVVEVEDVFLQGRTNENSEISNVHVWEGGHEVVWQNNDVTGTRNETLNERWNVPDNRIRSALGISVRVEFDDGTPTGMVTFSAAGAQFDE